MCVLSTDLACVCYLNWIVWSRNYEIPNVKKVMKCINNHDSQFLISPNYIYICTTLLLNHRKSVEKHLCGDSKAKQYIENPIGVHKIKRNDVSIHGFRHTINIGNWSWTDVILRLITSMFDCQNILIIKAHLSTLYSLNLIRSIFFIYTCLL